MKILLLDEDPSVGRALERELPGVALAAASEQGQGLRLLAQEAWELVVVDAGFCGAGLELLGRIHTHGRAPVVLLAAEPTIELTLEAFRLGAHDVLPKPPTARRLLEILGPAGAARRVRAVGEARPAAADAVIGASDEMLAVFKGVARVAGSDATVLVLGESGTGKEMVARVLHAQSARSRGPFVAINCAAIPENLLESELFGHEKGAFTGAIGRRVGRFERAAGGTLFLDEIGDMSLALQAKILRALQEREIERVGGAAPVPIDVRVVAATNGDLQAATRAGHFREDLFYRLAVVTLRLPPLRARGNDLWLLVDHFVARYAREHRRPICGISEAVLERLAAHPWPGNVRQLRNVIERAVVMSSGEVLLPEHLPPEILQPAAPADVAAATLHEGPLLTLEAMERQMIRRALSESRHNLTLAAERLGIHRNTLRRKIAQYHLAEA